MNGYLARSVKFKTVSLVIKILIVLTFVIFTSSNLEAAKKKDKKEKDCIYCKKYEKLSEWPESERPEAFIYEKIDYPEKMFHKITKQASKNKVQQEKKFMQDL